MARVLITGVDGFTGRYLAPLLAAGGHEVHGMVQEADRQRIDGVASLHAGLTLQTPLRSKMSSVEWHPIESCTWRPLHISPTETRARCTSHGTCSEHVTCSSLLLALARRPEAVVLASSANIYGNSREGALDETTRPEPANDYAVSKMAMEAIVRLYSSRLPIIVSRPFNYTGRGQSEAFLLPKIVSHSRSRAEWIELGNVAVARDFSDVRDVANAYAHLLQTPAALGRTVNLCSGTAHSLAEVLAMVESLSGHPLPVRVNTALVRQNEIRILKGDRTLLASLVPSLPPPRPLGFLKPCNGCAGGRGSAVYRRHERISARDISSDDTDNAWEQWRKDPYYAVLTESRFRADRLDKGARQDFFLSGELDVAHILNTVRRYGGEGFRPSRVLDFGCGVGRLALPLAAVAAEVVGVDVSPSMLAEARRNAEEHKVQNVRWVESDDTLSLVDGKFDLVCSHIVLQHIDVERGRLLFERLAGLIQPGGWGLIHVTFAWKTFASTFGQVPPSAPPEAPAPPTWRNWLRSFIFPAQAPSPPQPAPVQADPEMLMHFYNLSELMFLLHAVGVSHVHLEFVDHEGVIGAHLAFQAPSR